MTSNSTRSRERIATGVVGLAVSFIVSAVVVGWPAESGVGSVAQESGQWTPQSPVPFLVSGAAVPTPNNYNTYNSGRVAAFAVDPRDQSRWLLGVGNGGVWETRDAGGTWTPITDDAPTLATGAIAFAPSNPDIVYVGTGESGTFTGVTHVGVGLLKSTNGGHSWSLLGQSSLARGSVRRLRVDPNNADVVSVALTRANFGRDSNGPAPSPPPYGVLRSTDGGANWTRTLPGVATALEVDPRSFSRQYAAIAVGNDFNGIYRSANGGATWSRIDGPWWANPADNVNVSNGRIELAISPSNPDVVYASIAESIPSPRRNSLLGLFRTDNAWSDRPNWIQIPTQASGSGGYCGPTPDEGGKCDYSHVISVDPRDANTLFAGGQRHLWRCTNCGASPTWTDVTGNRVRVFVHVDYHVLEWAGNRLITGNDGGVFSTIDLGATWQDHNRTLTTNKFYAGALHPTDPNFLLGGARDFGLVAYRATMGWRTLRLAGEGGDLAMSSSRPDTDWMSNRAALRGIFRTTDGGNTSVQVDAGIDKTGAAFVAPVRKCPANDNVFLAGTIRVWRTNNFFNSAMPSWTANSPARPFPTPGFDSSTDPGTIQAITFVEGDRDCNTYVYGTRGGEVRVTRDGGTTWTDLDPSKGLPARPINSLAFDPSNANRVFAAVSSYDSATPAKPGHIFRSDNALSASPTWTRVGPPNQPFADMPFNVIKIDPRDTRIVYAGSDNGLWRSADGGTTFAKVGRESGLPPASVNDIQINPTTNRTVIFTYGRGAFELTR